MQLFELESRKDLGTLLNAMGLKGVGAEIGVAYGENAKDILDKWEGEAMYLIDPYKLWAADEYVDGSRVLDWKGCLDYAKEHLKDHADRLIWLRMTSDEAFEYGLPDLDFVYIDGNHHNPQVTRDIENYWTLVKPGGVFGGHDYYDLDTEGYRCEVKTVVDAFAKRNGLVVHVTEKDQSWWIVK